MEWARRKGRDGVGRVLIFEWVSSAVEGYTTAVGGTETVLAGTVNIGDIQIRTDFDVGITDATLVTNISWRVRSDKNNDGIFSEYVGLSEIQLFHGTNTFGSAASVAVGAGNIQLRQGTGVTSTAKNDGEGWVIFSHSFAPGTITAIRSLRMDAVDFPGTGFAFEVDWLKVEAIPETEKPLVIVGFLNLLPGNPFRQN